MDNNIEEKLKKFLDTGADHNDPYWKLFRVKELVNDSLVEAVKYGFREALKNSNSKEKEYSLLLEDALTHYKNLIDSMTVINEHGGYKMTQPLIDHTQKLNKLKSQFKIVSDMSVGRFSTNHSQIQSFPRTDKCNVFCKYFSKPENCPIHGKN